MKNYRIKYYLLPALFLAFLLLPFLNEEFQFFDPGETNEKRELADKPILSLDSIDQFPPAYDAYLGDHFNLRNFYIKWHSYVDYKFLNKSSYPDLVVVGKKGWLFYNEGLFPVDWKSNYFSNKEMQQFASLIQKRTEYYKSLGTDYYVFIIPNKQTVYSEFLPNRLDMKETCETENRIDQLLAYYTDTTGLQNVVYLRQILLNMKKEGLLYKKLDHHWNDLGSFYASSFILEKISEDNPNLKNVLNLDNFEVYYDEKYAGDLTAMLGIENLCSEELPYLKCINSSLNLEIGNLRYYTPLQHFPYPDEYEKVMTTGDTSLPKAVIIRDSFASFMLWQLSYGFNETIYIWDFWNYGLNAEIIEKERPEFVINILVEKNVETLIKSKK
ncbi:MAG TPA: hypothetical protein VIN10_02130 [Bacteroidales bacterium]